MPDQVLARFARAIVCVQSGMNPETTPVRCEVFITTDTSPYQMKKVENITVPTELFLIVRTSELFCSRTSPVQRRESYRAFWRSSFSWQLFQTTARSLQCKRNVLASALPKWIRILQLRIMTAKFIPVSLFLFNDFFEILFLRSENICLCLALRV
jgi:hypothetical protein